MIRAVRILVAVSVLVLAACAATNVPEKDDWFVLERSGTDGPEIVLVRRRLPTESVRARYPVLLRVEWAYESLENGPPTQKEAERGWEIYAALDKIIGREGVYAMSRTGDGGRTIYYYVEEPRRHAAALRRYFDSLPPISIRISVRGEPDWRSVSEVLGAVKLKPGRAA
jgi:hypothetical protein